MRGRIVWFGILERSEENINKYMEDPTRIEWMRGLGGEEYWEGRREEGKREIDWEQENGIEEEGRLIEMTGKEE